MKFYIICVFDILVIRYYNYSKKERERDEFMNTEEFLSCMNTGKVVKGGSELHKYMTALSYEAMKVTTELNGKYHSPEEIRELLSKIICKPVDESLVLFPPFYTDCGKNITIGKNVFIGSCCYFQDQGRG